MYQGGAERIQFLEQRLALIEDRLNDAALTRLLEESECRRQLDEPPSPGVTPPGR